MSQQPTWFWVTNRILQHYLACNNQLLFKLDSKAVGGRAGLPASDALIDAVLPDSLA